jgi:hypothetical protein
MTLSGLRHSSSRRGFPLIRCVCGGAELAGAFVSDRGISSDRGVAVGLGDLVGFGDGCGVVLSSSSRCLTPDRSMIQSSAAAGPANRATTGAIHTRCRNTAVKAFSIDDFLFSVSDSDKDSQDFNAPESPRHGPVSKRGSARLNALGGTLIPASLLPAGAFEVDANSSPVSEQRVFFIRNSGAGVPASAGLDAFVRSRLALPLIEVEVM